MKGQSGDRRFLRFLTIALLLCFAWVGGAAAAAIQSFALPDALPGNDDSSSAVAIGFPLNFFGVTHAQLFVNNNGNVTFGAPLSAFTPFGLVGTRQSIIAPFFADVDTRGAGSGIVRFGTPSGRTDLFVVDWVSVGYFNQKDDKLNSFQLVLQDLSAVPDFAAGDFRIIFNYDRIRWETGDASGGTNGLGGNSARVGFSNGSGEPGTFFELEGSGQNGALLNGAPRSLVRNRIPPADTSLPRGRYQFVVRNGAVAQADLAIAAEIIEEGDDTGFDLVVRNFGPSDAVEVLALFDLSAPRGAHVWSIRPARFCEVDDSFGMAPPRGASCDFPLIANGRCQRITVVLPIRLTQPPLHVVVVRGVEEHGPTRLSADVDRVPAPLRERGTVPAVSDRLPLAGGLPLSAVQARRGLRVGWARPPSVPVLPAPSVGHGRYGPASHTASPSALVRGGLSGHHPHAGVLCGPASASARPGPL
jgi:Nidogen-like